MILAINTAQPAHEMALLRENPSNKGELELISEKTWTDERRDVENLVPFLQKMLEEAGLEKSDITDIVVVKGPGSFTSLRTGVAFANALAEGLHAKLYALTSFALLRLKAALPRTEPGCSCLVILHAGRLDVGIQFQDDPIRVGPLATLLNDYPHDTGIHVVAELPEALREELHPLILEKKWTLVEGHELQTLGETLMTYGLAALVLGEVEPFYLKGPHITHTSDPWKK